MTENTPNEQTTPTLPAAESGIDTANRQMRNLGGDYCFACGKDNPYSLKLTFSAEGEKFVTHKTVPSEYQSYTGVVHGGILATMLDEAMGGYLIAHGEQSVTARLDIRFRQSTPVGVPLTVSAWQDARRRNFVTMKAEVTLPDGTVTAEATATMAVTGPTE